VRLVKTISSGSAPRTSTLSIGEPEILAQVHVCLLRHIRPRWEDEEMADEREEAPLWRGIWK
jgi:hypothetical protein